MFSFLGGISPALWQRYETLERNLRSASASFFDAYLDLLEEFLRTVADKAGAEVPVRATAGELLRCGGVLQALLDVGVAEEDVRKISDYVLKINRHKHGAEKALEAERAVIYLSLLHRVTAAYAAPLGIQPPAFVESYFYAIFNSYERENRTLREDISGKVEALAGQVEEIGAYVRRVEGVEAAKQEEERLRAEAAARQQEEERRAAETKRFLKTAKRRYLYAMGKESFDRNKVLAMISSLATIVFLFIFYFVFRAYHLGNYGEADWRTAYWLLLVPLLVFACHQVSLAVRIHFTSADIDEAWLSRHVSVGRGPVGEAINYFSLHVGYTLWPIFGTLFVLFFTAMAWVDYGAAWMLFIFLPLIAAGMFASRYFFNEIFMGFFVISYGGRSPSTGEHISLYFSVLLGKYITEEECRKKHPHAFV